MEEPPRKRDLWEKISLVLQSSGGLLTAVTVAIIGLIGSSYLKDREIKENSYRQEEQLRESKNRIYIELTSKREEAESALRKDMFVSIIQSFLRPASASLDERVLNLELLSYNFHESLNLKPLFLYLERQISSSGDPRKKEYLDRLYKVAIEISRKQMLVLEGAGQKTDRIIDLENLKKNPGGSFCRGCDAHARRYRTAVFSFRPGRGPKEQTNQRALGNQDAEGRQGKCRYEQRGILGRLF